MNYLYHPRALLNIWISIFLLLSGRVVLAQSGPSDVAKSWAKADVYLPGKFFATSPDNARLDAPVPVVLLMHGCSGIAATDKSWANFLSSSGYAVVLPNSFSRDRPVSCDPRSRKGGLFKGVYEFRAEEMNYAVEQLAAASWVDHNNVFLMGHSEGSWLVSTMPTPQAIRGVIVSAGLCQKSSGASVLAVPSTVPLLAVDHEADPWYPWGNGKHCSDVFGDRKNARQVTLPGMEHDTFAEPAKAAVLNFLREFGTGTASKPSPSM